MKKSKILVVVFVAGLLCYQQYSTSWRSAKEQQQPVEVEQGHWKEEYAVERAIEKAPREHDQGVAEDRKADSVVFTLRGVGRHFTFNKTAA